MKTHITSHPTGWPTPEFSWPSNGLRWAKIKPYILLGWSFGFVATLLARFLIAKGLFL